MDEPFFRPPSAAQNEVREQAVAPPRWAGQLRRIPTVITFGTPDAQDTAPAEDATPPPVSQVRPGWILADTPTSRVEVVSLDAYAEGIELWIRGVSSQGDLQLRSGVDLDVFGRHWPMVGQDSTRLPRTLLRVGVQTADGRRVTNISGWDSATGGPSLWPLSGGGSGGRHHQGYWITLPPEAGGVTLACEWPAAGISLIQAEIGAEEIRAAAHRSAALFPRDGQVERDGRSWRLGSAETVAWIRAQTGDGPGIAGAIPSVFAADATLEPVDGRREELHLHQQRLVQLLAEHGDPGPWWLGFLDTGAADVVFPFAPRQELYPTHGYVVVQAGPPEAIGWRQQGNDGAMADLIFPSDRSWLFHSTWDDEESFLGGPDALISALEADPLIGPRVRRAQP